MLARIALVLLFAIVAPALLAQSPVAPTPIATPSVALFYGASPPLDELAAFDAVVLEPDHAPRPLPAARHTAWFAYVSLGEVHPTRPYFKALPGAWKLGTNAAFDSAVIDQAQPAWAEFFCETIVRPLWDRGFRGFFLDTLDSYHLVAKTDAERARQEAGLAAVITLLKKKFPEAKLMFNRGFEILPKVHGLVYAVAAESLYRSYDHGVLTPTEN
ncbi:MAG: endo alpha-1,4 polygalactosaminidase [Betaproteobacteria bacterium]